MSSVALGDTYSLAARWTEVLRGLSPSILAKRIGASPRTVENWQDGANGPTWAKTVAMLHDDELCALLLEAAGRGDLAHEAKVIAARKRLRELEGQ